MVIFTPAVHTRYFTRPFCLLEMWVAVAWERPIFIVEVERKFDRGKAHIELRLATRLAPSRAHRIELALWLVPHLAMLLS